MTAASPSASDPFDAGPYTRFLAAMRLGRQGTRYLLDRATIRRAVVLAGIAWLPLVILAAVQGLAIGPTPRESLLLDPAPYARYLVALPLLVLAEAVCIPRLSGIAHEFANSGLVPESEQARYEALITSTRSLLDKPWIEIVLAAVAYLIAIASSDLIYPVAVSSWTAPVHSGVRSISFAGWWRLLVSQPLFLTLVAAWFWRMVLWSRFLLGMSRLDLCLVPAHPDRVGGIRFLELSLRGFRGVAAALGAAAAGGVARAVLFDHRPLKDFASTVGILLAVVLIVFVGPLLVFYRSLAWTRVNGMLSYGKLAGSLGREFQARWLGGSTTVDPEALSRPDFSATTDLFSIAGNVYAMRPFPVELRALFPLVYSTLLPFVPVILTVIPFDELLRYAAKIVI